jgi:hypothetical protein
VNHVIRRGRRYWVLLVSWVVAMAGFIGVAINESRWGKGAPQSGSWVALMLVGWTACAVTGVWISVDNVRRPGPRFEGAEAGPVSEFRGSVRVPVYGRPKRWMWFGRLTVSGDWLSLRGPWAVYEVERAKVAGVRVDVRRSRGRVELIGENGHAVAAAFRTLDWQDVVDGLRRAGWPVTGGEAAD